MPKPKLTPEQKVALRKDLKTKLAAGVPRSVILETLSKKYGISSEGMRWYLKGATPSKKQSLANKAKPAPQSKAARGPARKAAKVVAKRKSPSPKGTSNGHAAGLP